MANSQRFVIIAEKSSDSTWIHASKWGALRLAEHDVTHEIVDIVRRGVGLRWPASQVAVADWELRLLELAWSHRRLAEIRSSLRQLDQLLSVQTHVPFDAKSSNIAHAAADLALESALVVDVATSNRIRSAHIAMHELAFSPHLLPALHFPFEHKIAVLAPLLLPCFVSMFGAVRALKSRK